MPIRLFCCDIGAVPDRDTTGVVSTVRDDGILGDDGGVSISDIVPIYYREMAEENKQGSITSQSIKPGGL